MAFWRRTCAAFLPGALRGPAIGLKDVPEAQSLARVLTTYGKV
jgi:hypothetical protein